MLFLMPSQQCQSTAEKTVVVVVVKLFILTLIWVPGNFSVSGNEIVDQLVNKNLVSHSVKVKGAIHHTEV